MVESNAVEALTKALSQDPQNTNNTYTAVVSRIDNEQIVWVQIAGSDVETPTASTSAEVKQGDVVTVEWRNNKLYIAGNTSNPAAGAIRVNKIEQAAQIANEAAASAVNDAGIAREAAESVQGIAIEAQTNAEIAKTSAEESLKGLGMTQEVLDVVNWVASHGVYVKATTYVEGTSYYTVVGTEVTDPTQQTDELVGRYYELENGVYVKTEDTEYDDEKTYYFVTGTPVPESKSEDISRYYTLNVRDAMGDYIQSHLALTNEGLYVMADGSDWKVLIDDEGVYIVNPDNEKVTKYMDSITLGKDDGTQSYLFADYHSLQMIDKEGGSYVHLSDLRDKDDNYQATLTETFIGDGNTNNFSVKFNVTEEVSATDSSDVSNVANRNFRNYAFRNAPANGATVTIVYKTDSILAKAYTLGRRNNNEPIGAMSVAEGYNSTASGVYSHVEGHESTASGTCSHAEGGGSTAKGIASHAEGNGSTASGNYSHAEGASSTASGSNSHAEGNGTTASGYASHAEGNGSTASGSNSHAEGGSTRASGKYSHSQNRGTVAQRRSQTVLGEYNTPDTSGVDEGQRGDFAFIIGNGASDNNRSNALTVDWKGNIDTNNTDIVRDTPPSADQWIERIALNDARGELIGTIRTPFKSNGDEGIQLETRRTINGGNVFNGFGLWVASDGTPLVTINQPAAWRQALGLSDPYPRTINLGTCCCAGILTASCSSLTFTIPTGRVLGDGASISKLTFNIVVRASNSNGTGYYIIKASSGGSDSKAFDSTKSFSFYNANDVSKTLTTSQRTITLQGATNILVNFAGDSDIFSGTPTIRGYINNNACVVSLTNIVVELSYS